ncbi:MAG TPA: hypothetical protein VK633_11265, partial [Verrucomicrobiae bacterium]|nr:hypothetical protein [Verrucomicrobiae bacterium]
MTFLFFPVVRRLSLSFTRWVILCLSLISSWNLSAAQKVINIDFGAHLNPFFTTKSGPAAVGISGSDVWNLFSRDDGLVNGGNNNLVWQDNTPSGASLQVQNAPGAWYTLNSDPMFQSYLYPAHGEDIILTLRQLPAGSFDLYVYAHGQPAAENAFIEVRVGAQAAGSRSTSSAALWDGAGWVENSQYVLFSNLALPAGETLTVTSHPGDAGLAVINGLQMVFAETSTSPPETPAQGELRILAQPQSKTIAAGQSASFYVQAVGNGPLHYQWYHRSALIPAAVESTFTLTNAAGADAGPYQVFIFDDTKLVVSAVATLVVSLEPSPLDPPSNPPTGSPGPFAGRLINLDYGAHQNPYFSTKTGPAAVGLGSTDVWNLYSRDDGFGNFSPNGTITDLKWSDNSPSTLDLSVQNAPGAWFTLNSDPMFQSYLYPGGVGTISSIFSQVPEGTFDLYVYAHGQPASENAVIEVRTESQNFGAQSTSASSDWDSGSWQEGKQFVLFRNVTVAPGQTLTVLSRPGLA